MSIFFGTIVTFFTDLRMELTLREEDRRAVDLILDGAASVGGKGNGNGGSTGFAAVDPAMGDRVARVTKLVHLLSAMPQIDPPADLVERTLHFVESASSRTAAEVHIPDLLAAQRPIV
jgi:hypothetical protein